MKPSAKVDGFFVSQCECFVFIFIYKKRNDFYISMQIEHIFMTYDGGAYNPSKLSYDPIAQEILDDPRVSNSLIFDKNRRTIYAQGLEYGKHHHTTSNNWHTATVFDIEALGKGAKKGRSLDYNITESKIYAQSPKSVKFSPNNEYLYSIDTNNVGRLFHIDKNYNLELLSETESVANVFWNYDGSILFVEEIKPNIGSAISAPTHYHTFVDIENEYDFPWQQDVGTVNTFDIKDNFEYICINGLNFLDAKILLFLKPNRFFTINGRSVPGGVKWYTVFNEIFISPDQSYAIVYADESLASNPGGRHYTMYIDLSSGNGHTINDNDILFNEWIEGNLLISPDGNYIMSCNYSFIDCISKTNLLNGNGNTIALFDYSYDDVQWISNTNILLVHNQVAGTIDIGPKGSKGGGLEYNAAIMNATTGEVIYENFNNYVKCYLNDDKTKAIAVIIGIAQEVSGGGLLKGNNVENIGDVYIWNLTTNEKFGSIYNIINLSTSYDNNNGIEAKGPSRSINYDQPNIKVIWNDDSSMFVIIDEFGNATVFDDEGNVISENIATGVSGGHWSGGNLYLDNALETLNKSVIVDINLDIEGNLTYQTANLQMGSGKYINSIELIPGSNNGYVITGVTQSSSGQISYSYSEIHVRQLSNIPTYLSSHDSYNIVNVNLDRFGEFTYSYSDLKSTANDGSYIGAYNVNSPTSYLRVITGINQERDGKISYAYQSIYTNHGGKVQVSPGYDEDFISMVQLSADGQLTGGFGTFSNARTGSTTSGVINNVNLDHTGKLSYSYVSLENLLNVTPIGIDDGQHTLQNNSSYQVITNITQNTNGSISYTYSNINTTHTSSGQNDGDLDDYVITYVWLDADGNFSYKYRNQETTADDGLASFRQDVSTPTITLQNAHSYRFITNINQAKDGKIVYTYADVNTTHSGSVGGHFAYDLSLSADGVLSGKQGTFSNERTGETTDGVINNVSLGSDGKLSYSYISLANLLNVTPIGSDDGAHTLQNNTSYQVITNITQNANGSISYTYSNINTIHTTDTSNSNTNQVVTYVNLDSDGNFTYHLTDLSVTSGTAGSNMILTNDDTYKFITGITQASDGKISYTYSQLNTNFTYQGDSVNGPIYELNIDKTGKVSYVHKNLSVDSGVLSNDGDIITNDSTYRFITGISQASDGKISYTYGVFNTNFSNNGTTNGVLTNVNIDNAGHLSYDSVDLTTNSGNYSEASYNTGVKIATTGTSYTRVINNISQSANGKISYSYVGIYTDQRDYTYHDLTLTGSDITLDDENNVKVISKIIIDKQGNAGDHTLTYSYVQVPTREYVDSLITANDAMRYCGTFSIGLDENDNPFIKIIGRDEPDLSKGAVYKYDSTEQATIGNHVFSLGDWIMSNNDENTYTGFQSGRSNVYSINSLNGWDTFNVNIFINSVGDNATNQNNSNAVITNIYANDSGTISYTYTNLTATIAGVDDNNTNDLLGSTYDVITGINVVQNGLETQLSYTYTTIKVDRNHHSGEINTWGRNGYDNDFVIHAELSAEGTLSGVCGTFTTEKKNNAASGVVTYVNLDHSGKLSYSYTDLSSTTADGQKLTNISLASGNVLTGITQTADGKITYSYATIGNDSFANHHSTDNTQTGGASKVIGAVHLSESGELSYSYTDIAKVAYHYTPTWPSGLQNNTVIIQDGSGLSSPIVIPYDSTNSEQLTSYISLSYDSKGHLTNSTKHIYKLKHGEVTTDGTSLEQKVITIAAGGTNSDDLTSYTSLTASNGHLTNATYGSYVFKHGAPSGGTTYSLSVPVGSYINALTLTYDTNGHMTGYGFSTAPFVGDFSDEKTKFVAFTTDKIYLGGTKTQAGNVTTNTYIDGITYVNNGTVFMEKAVIGNSSDDTISINAKAVTFNTPDTQFNFTGLKALWGVVGS